MSEVETKEPETKEPETKEPEKKDDTSKYKEDMFRFKKELKEFQSENEKLRNQLKQFEEENLSKTNNYKELYERKAKEVEDYKNKWTTDRNTFFNSIKIGQIEKAAVESGIRKEALEDLAILDTSSVITETTSTGNINVLGAKEFIDGLKQTRPHWFKDSSGPNINNNRPDYSKGKELSAEEILKLQTSDPERYKQEMLKKFKK